MSTKSLNQEKAFKFLLEKFKSGQQFTKEEFIKASGWTKPGTYKTHWSKHFIPLLVPLEGTSYRVGEVFRRYNTWEKFKKYVAQNRQLAANYATLTYESVMLFDFFMPLTNEGYLRTSLDALFYKDSIIKRLKSIELKKLKVRFKSTANESDTHYYDRVCNWISGKFGGYSISHVNGRFRADSLKSIQEYSNILAESGRYLVDETTAIVRFIFPCGKQTKSTFDSSASYISNLSLPDIDEKNKVMEEASQIRFFFHLLFVQNIVEVVNGEDEIWLLESGLKNNLHIWRVQND